MNKYLQSIFLKQSDIEIEQLEQHHYVESIPTNNFETNNSKMVLNNAFFFNKDVYISKHNRYAEYPLHTHTFLEMNYIFSGEVREVVDGQVLTLHTGDLLLMDVGCEHSIDYLNTNDILVNLLFQDRNININLLNSMRSSNNQLYAFLLNRQSGEQNTTKFLLFKNETAKHEIKDTLELIIEEYFQAKEFSDIIIQNYLSILFAQLTRNYQIPSSRPVSRQQRLVIDILKEIELNFSITSPAKLAVKFKYNKNYLSNIFKKEVGIPISVAITRQQLIEANQLIRRTNYPIDEVIQKVGMTNKTFFYKKYEALYHKLPGDSRESTHF